MRTVVFAFLSLNYKTTRQLLSDAQYSKQFISSCDNYAKSTQTVMLQLQPNITLYIRYTYGVVCMYIIKL